MVKSFKVQKNNKLTITDELVYSTLCCYSDNNGISNISRQRIAEKQASGNSIPSQNTRTSWSN